MAELSRQQIDGGCAAESCAALLPHGDHQRSFVARAAGLNSWANATMYAGFWMLIVRLRARAALSAARIDCWRPSCTNVACLWKRLRTHSFWQRRGGSYGPLAPRL